MRHLHQDTLNQLMNGPIRKKLGIIPKDCSWGGNLRDRIQCHVESWGAKKGANSKALICRMGFGGGDGTLLVQQYYPHFIDEQTNIGLLNNMPHLVQGKGLVGREQKRLVMSG